MSGSWSRNNEKDSSKEGKEGEGSGWASTFLKVAGAVAATAAVAGSLYSILNQPEADVEPYRVQQPQYQEEELVTLYVNGSHKSNIPSAACGGFLCNSSGKWICGFTQKLDRNLRLDQTEKQAILTGLCWVGEMGKRKVAVMSDRKVDVDSVNNKSNMDDPLINEISKVLNSPHWKATLDYIPEKENRDARTLAKKAHNSSLHLQHFLNKSDIL